MSSSNSTTVRIEPRVVAESLEPGMLLRLGFNIGDEHRSMMRSGYAAIRTVDKVRGELTFDALLNVLIVAAVEGDQLFEYEPPCSRCECRRCQRERSTQRHGEDKT